MGNWVGDWAIKSALHYVSLLQTFNLTLISTIINTHARSTRPSCRSSCCTHCSAEETDPLPSSFTCYTYSQLKLNRTVWWLPIISQVSGQFVHLAKVSLLKSLQRILWKTLTLPTWVGVCPQLFGQHWLQEVWWMEATWFWCWGCQEEECPKLFRLLVIHNGPCSIIMLQHTPAGRYSHLTWRVTWWTSWPSLCSCWSM